MFPRSLIAVAFSIVVGAAVCLTVSSCAQHATDPQRQAVVKSFNRLQPIIERSFKVSRGRILMVTKLNSLGVVDGEEESARRFRVEFKKEFKEEIPEKLLSGEVKVGDIVHYVATEFYGVDYDKLLDRKDVLNSSLVNPELRERMEKEKNAKQEKGAEDAEASGKGR